MLGGVTTAGRKRAAVELVAREDAELRRTARRFSLCEDDAEDAYQRALEILLTKAPTERQRDLLRWTKTVVKHEALALRRYRERMLGHGAVDAVGDPVERLACDNAGPGERTEQRESFARSREALRALKPAELRALTLLAAGYSYAEIGEATGFSRTKVNRCLAEGRERFRLLLSRARTAAAARSCCRCSPPTATARPARSRRRRCASTCAPAGPAGRPPAPTATPRRRSPRWRRRCPSRARCSSGGTNCSSACTRGSSAGAARPARATARRSRRSPPPAARAAPGWRRWRKCWRSAPGRSAARPAWRPASSRRRSACTRTTPPRRPPNGLPNRRADRPNRRRSNTSRRLLPEEPKPDLQPQPSPAPRPEPPAEAPAPEPEAVEAGAVEYAPPVEEAAAPPPAEAAGPSGGGAAGEFGP